MANERVSVVTGAASGIGRATAKRLAAAGHVDVARDASVDDVAQWIEKELGPVGVLVNSAGVLQNVAEIGSFSLDEHDKVWAINYRGTYLCCRAFAPRMAARRSGNIVNISSTSAVDAMPLLAYGPSKAA